MPEVIFATNGCIHLAGVRVDSHPVEAIFSFGLPRVSPTRLWSEGGVLRGLWVTNGIQYTETVFIGQLTQKIDTNAAAVPVLLIEIYGSNTNSEYAEASAEVSMLVDSQVRELEIRDGLLWRSERGRTALLGRIEVPAPGIKVAGGKVLRFSGNMPPAERGSLMLLIPLQPVGGEAVIEQLRDLDFSVELRKALKNGVETGNPESRADKQVSFTFGNPSSTQGSP